MEKRSIDHASREKLRVLRDILRHTATYRAYGVTKPDLEHCAEEIDKLLDASAPVASPQDTESGHQEN